ncbi:MAG: arginine repressor [Candidatus Limnocylindrales bacterium]
MSTDGVRGAKRQRQRTILELLTRTPVASQDELADRLRERGFDVTQATVSRDVAELRLVKVVRGERHVYISPDDLANGFGAEADARLARLLAEAPVTVGRSGLTLILHVPPGGAQPIALAIDQSSRHEQEGTLAGDDTILVLFTDEPRLERWLARFRVAQGLAQPEGAST